MRAAYLALIGLFLVGCYSHTTFITQPPLTEGAGAYAEIYYHNDSGIVLDIPASNSYINQTYVTACKSKGITCDTFSFTIIFPGEYATEYHISFAGGATNEYHATIGINGVEALNCHGARVIGTGGDVGNMGGTCILSLLAGDVITLMIENEDTGQDITLQDSSFNVVKI